MAESSDMEAVMRHKIFYAMSALLLLYSAAYSSPQGKLGVGLMLIEPSGLSAKAWMSGSTAIAGGLGWSAEANHYFHLHADFLFSRVRLASDRNLVLDFTLGAGGKLVFRDYEIAWFRIPLGLDFLLQQTPLEFFFDVVPTFNFSKLKLFGAIGFRYVFTS
jgi:hypothetical protein